MTCTAWHGVTAGLRVFAVHVLSILLGLACGSPNVAETADRAASRRSVWPAGCSVILSRGTHVVLTRHNLPWDVLQTTAHAAMKVPAR